MQGMGADDPVGQNDPAGHGPVHADVVMAEVLPNLPALQLVHAGAPAKAYFPVGHVTACEELEPAGQAYPA